MNSEIFNLIRATLFCLLVLIPVLLYITDDSRHYPQYSEPTIIGEPAETTPR